MFGWLPSLPSTCASQAFTVSPPGTVELLLVKMPRLARRYQWDWTPGLSWWLRDSSGNWHVVMADEPRMPDDGMQAYTLDDGMQAVWLRLTPPLATIPDAAEIVVTGPATRVRATVPVHPARG